MEWSSDGCSSALQEGVTYAGKSLENTTAALKGYTAVKTPADFFKPYAENSKKAFDAAVAQPSKTSELVVKLTNDSFAPISNRVSVITSKMKADEATSLPSLARAPFPSLPACADTPRPLARSDEHTSEL